MANLATPPHQAETTEIAGIAGDVLIQFVDRIERLEEEKAELGQDIRDIYLEAKGNGFDPKIMRQIISLRKKDRREVAEEEALLLLYKQALGMADTTTMQ
ncbi:MAG: DUF2312 domain-containing protein [Magnetococcales bacterium]|nr:DUF2312 domain-containing protein [Magnetococcales bacterium]MBF0116176.1 DUF2312 domain-containing protein [Magnetococcales bacterium]